MENILQKYEFFWDGVFSQWYVAPFKIGHKTFNTCEQWMMYQKAITFNDSDTARKILATNSPREQKRLGRAVKNFDDRKWMSVAYNIVVQGNRAKFSQHPELLEELKATIGKTLVEASPFDTRWGIGMSATDPGVKDSANWRGDNLLGKALTQVRKELLET